MITPNRIPRRFLFLLFAWAMVAGGCSKRNPEAPAGVKDELGRSAVTALGRVTPGRAVIAIAAQLGGRLLKLEVTDGQKVRAGDVLAYLDTYPLRVAERQAARVALEEARERLESETAYSEALIQQSQKAVLVLELAVDRERKEMKRVEELGKLATKKDLDDHKFLVQSREAELAKANAELTAAQAALARTRSLVAIKSAEAQVKGAEAQLELTVIRAPVDGEILKVFTYPGERIGNEPILEMGDTANMHVIAEVHESDIGSVRVGQHVTVTSVALPEPVHGVVEEVGALIHKSDVLDLDPRAPQDTRVVEVRVKLEKSPTVSRLTHLEVSTRIDLATPAAGSKSASR